jgi:hypothetical protein
MNAEDVWTEEHERLWKASIPAAVATKIKEIRELYEAQGYHVVERPRRDEFPFEVGYFAAYRPSLLAKRGNDAIVFEIRSSAGSLRRPMERAEEIRKHRNWRFFLVTDEDVVPHDSHVEPQPWWKLEQAVQETPAIVESLPPWMQLLALWAVLEGVLRRTAVDEGIPIELLPASTLITALYDDGPLPYESYEPLKCAAEVHRRVRHGYPTADETVAEAVGAVSEWLPQMLPHAVERAA